LLLTTVCSADDVFVSIPPQAFLVEEFARDLVRVDVLLPPGASPATFEPSPKQLASLDRSRLYLQIGAPFEGSVLEKLAGVMPELRIVDCRDGIQLEPMEGTDHDHGTALLDPHIWLDPRRMKIVAENTARALQEILPDEASSIESRLAPLLDAIDAADREVARVLAPYSGRRMVVFHPAFGYFARRYGLVQTAIEVEGKAPSPRRLATVIEELRHQRVRSLFVQPQFARSTAERVANALGCELVELDPLARDYLGNLETMAVRIAEALQ
jgi:zinc transport system substrate-binding protein